ncbi:MAG: guanylate kinase [Thermodesulfobacteriota bacterium]
MDEKGKVFVVSAPSGAGKSSLCSYLVKNIPGLHFSVSYTTRAPRSGEKNGREYFFTDESDFEKRISQGEFVEWARVHGNYYGTSKKYIENAAKKGENILLEIDVQGAAQIKKVMPESFLIFILPPSFEELKNRLLHRATDSEEIIEKRLTAAADEMSKADLFDYQIINDDFEKSSSELAELVTAAINNKLDVC